MSFDKAARFALDNERCRLRALDIEDGGRRLYEWTLKTFAQEDLEIMAARKKTALTANMGLATALSFVSVAGTKDDAPYKTHVALNNKFAVACDGQITAGHPIAEELECCPHLGQLRAALARTGESLSIAELPTGQLSITGDKLTAKIPCIAFDALPDSVLTKPDPVCAVIDDRIKAAFGVCGLMVSEAGDKAFKCGMLLRANDCTGTDGVLLIQYWHGIDLPPGLFVPKIFAAAVCKIKLPLVGFGFTAGRSVTFHFEGGAWIKTQLYEDKYPEVSQIIDAPCTPQPVPDNLFEAIEAVAAFDENECATLDEGKVVTANAEFQVDGLAASCSFSVDYTKMIAPLVKSIDLSRDDRAFFFGENLRGVVMGMRRQKPQPAERVVALSGDGDEVPF